MNRPLIIPANEISELARHAPTPFHLYDAQIIEQRCKLLKESFSKLPNFNNYFAVKATPNPYILDIIKKQGFGFDCSSLAELYLAQAAGVKGDKIMFTSNNTPLNEFKKAKELGAIINLDDSSHLEFLHEKIGLPELLCFRYNPGEMRRGNELIGDPVSAKFGMTKSQLILSYKKAKEFGVKEFGLHTMVISNCLDIAEFLETALSMLNLIVELKVDHDILIKFVNLGGGMGIPYKTTDVEVDVTKLGDAVWKMYQEIIIRNGLHHLAVYYECGRYVTGPAGVLVTRIIHQKNTYKKYLGVDCCINSLMRPALYGSYHHITVIKDACPSDDLPSSRNLFIADANAPDLEQITEFDVVGSLCENNDKLAIDRKLPISTSIGDLLVFHDTGAHGHCMGFNYNGKLRSAEYLKALPHSDGLSAPITSLQNFKLSTGASVYKIRNAEMLSDLFSTIPGHWGEMMKEETQLH